MLRSESLFAILREFFRGGSPLDKPEMHVQPGNCCAFRSGSAAKNNVLRQGTRWASLKGMAAVL